MTKSNRPEVFLFFCLALLFTLPPLEAGQDIWLVDTHGVSRRQVGEDGLEKIVYFRLREGRWSRSDAATFFGTQDPAIPVVVFSPGYTSTMSDTVEVGLGIARLCDRNRPLRLVLWNWPAEKTVCGLRRDIRSKIPVAATDARYQALFLKALHPESKVCVLGFSFGCRVACDAVSLLGADRPETMRLHLVLGGAATDWGDLAEGARCGNVPKVADRILVLYNPDDFRLQFYPLMYDRGYRPEALGRYGPPLRRILPEWRHRIEAVNLNPYIGVRHQSLIQFRTPPFCRRLGTYFFFDEYTVAGMGNSLRPQ